MANQPTDFNPNDLVRGIDASHFQGVIDWSQVAASGIKFAITKATEGTNVKDSQFSANYDGIKANGMIRGAYHFFHPSSDAQAQATNFLSSVNVLAPGDLPPALDVEVNDGQGASVIINGVQQWLQAVEAALGRKPMIYTTASFWNANLSGTGQFSDCPLWVAQYTFNPQPNIPQGFSNYAIWQFSEMGTINGVSGKNNVDLDRFNGTEDDLRTLAGF